MSGERGTLWYTRATAKVEFFFPEDNVDCRHCRYLRADANSARYKCCLTDEILGRLDRIGAACPIDHLTEEKDDGKEDDLFPEGCPF